MRSSLLKEEGFFCSVWEVGLGKGKGILLLGAGEGGAARGERKACVCSSRK